MSNECLRGKTLHGIVTICSHDLEGWRVEFPRNKNMSNEQPWRTLYWRTFLWCQRPKSVQLLSCDYVYCFDLGTSILHSLPRCDCPLVKRFLLPPLYILTYLYNWDHFHVSFTKPLWLLFFLFKLMYSDPLSSKHPRTRLFTLLWVQRPLVLPKISRPPSIMITSSLP